MSRRGKVEEILKEVAERANMKNWEILLMKRIPTNVGIIRDQAVPGEGLLSQFYKCEVRNKDTNEMVNAYIKIPPVSIMPLQNIAYSNEYCFYSIILPELDRFQKQQQVKEPFNNFAKFYCGSSERHEEYIGLENLTHQDYSITNKLNFLDANHLKTIFETYGKFHALSFAFKDHNTEQYQKLKAPIKDVFETVASNENYIHFVMDLLEIGFRVFKKKNESNAAKIRVVMDDVQKFFKNSATYAGSYSALSHGDCWSNNMMFKYDKDNNIENIKLIDFKLIRDSSPVHDLSYFFYSSASKKDLDKLDEYLDVYYDSFSKFARELGSSPKKLLPLEALKADWKVASLFGVFMSLMLWKTKLVPNENIQDVGNENMSAVEETNASFEDAPAGNKNVDVFSKNICDILNHAIEYNII